VPQLLQSKQAEIEKLLSRLSDVNDGMRSTLAGGADARSHTLARHRDILHDFQQARLPLQHACRGSGRCAAAAAVLKAQGSLAGW
jgi:Golgi SNAP receptor complex protein 1